MALNSRYKRRLLDRIARGQGDACCYCRRPFTAEGPTRRTLEHRKPKRDGGPNEVANFAAACLHCNQLRGRQIDVARRRRIEAARLRVAEREAGRDG
jgi:5-methylcytosine-specific restriction endonuclease McrA